MFFARPISKVMPNACNVGSELNARNPGAGSTRTVAGGTSGGWSKTHRVDKLLRRVVAFSSGMMHADVKDVDVSRRMKMNCLFRRWMSTAKETPTTVGGSLVLWCSSGSQR